MQITNITQVFGPNQAGPLPLVGQFQSNGGMLLFLISGAGSGKAYESFDPGFKVSMQSVAGGPDKEIGRSSSSWNGSGNPVTLPSLFVVRQGDEAVEYNVTIAAIDPNNTSFKCFFNLTVLEMM
jgi:hypothetical protein